MGVRTDTENLVSVTELSRNVSKFVSEAAEGQPKVILKNNRAAAVIISIDYVQRMDAVDELAENLQLWALALARLATDSGERHDLDDVIAEFGIDLDEDDDEG